MGSIRAARTCQSAAMWPVIGVGAAIIVAIAMLPALLVIALAEGFAWRSIVALRRARRGAGAGARLRYRFRRLRSAALTALLAHEREVLAAAGIAGGLVYWLFAGRKAAVEVAMTRESAVEAGSHESHRARRSRSPSPLRSAWCSPSIRGSISTSPRCSTIRQTQAVRRQRPALGAAFARRGALAHYAARRAGFPRHHRQAGPAAPAHADRRPRRAVSDRDAGAWARPSHQSRSSRIIGAGRVRSTSPNSAATDRFMPWWDPRGECPNNCSFVAGEPSGAFWTLAPAALAPPQWRALAYGAALAFGAAVGVLRIAGGGAFLHRRGVRRRVHVSADLDVHGLIYRWPATRMSERRVERPLAQTGEALRGALAALARRFGASDRASRPERVAARTACVAPARAYSPRAFRAVRIFRCPERRAKRRRQESRAGLFGRARHLDHSQVAADDLWLRGRDLHRRSRPGRGARAGARQGARCSASSRRTSSSRICARSSCATTCFRCSAPTRSTRANICSAPRSRGR